MLDRMRTWEEQCTSQGDICSCNCVCDAQKPSSQSWQDVAPIWLCSPGLAPFRSQRLAYPCLSWTTCESLRRTSAHTQVWAKAYLGFLGGVDAGLNLLGKSPFPHLAFSSITDSSFCRHWRGIQTQRVRLRKTKAAVRSGAWIPQPRSK